MINALPTISFVLYNAINSENNGKCFFFFLFQFQLLLPCFQFTHPLLYKGQLGRFFRQPKSTPNFKREDNIKDCFSKEKYQQSKTIVFDFLQFTVFVRLFRCSRRGSAYCRRGFRGVFRFTSLLGDYPPGMNVLSNLDWRLIVGGKRLRDSPWFFWPGPWL